MYTNSKLKQQEVKDHSGYNSIKLEQTNRCQNLILVRNCACLSQWGCYMLIRMSNPTAGTVDRLIYYGIYFVQCANKIFQGAGSVRFTAVLNPAVGPEKQLLLNYERKKTSEEPTQWCQIIFFFWCKPQIKSITERKLKAMLTYLYHLF